MKNISTLAHLIQHSTLLQTLKSRTEIPQSVQAFMADIETLMHLTTGDPDQKTEHTATEQLLETVHNALQQGTVSTVEELEKFLKQPQFSALNGLTVALSRSQVSGC